MLKLASRANRLCQTCLTVLIGGRSSAVRRRAVAVADGAVPVGETRRRHRLSPPVPMPTGGQWGTHAWGAPSRHPVSPEECGRKPAAGRQETAVAQPGLFGSDED